MYTASTAASYLATTATTKTILYKRRVIKKGHKSLMIDPGSYTAGKEVKINVSGSKFRIHESYLNRHSKTLLGSPIRNNFYDDRSKEFFFDRDPYIFRFIHKYYKTGRLHFSDSDCYESFINELRFFRISPSEISSCCLDGYELYLMRHEKKEAEFANKKITAAKKSFRTSCWKFTEEPENSLLAKTFHVISCLVIVLSVATNCVETVDCTNEVSLKRMKCGVAYETMFFAFDTACAGFFTLEFILRFYGSPERLKFIKGVMSLIDIIAILPYYVDLLLAELKLAHDNTASNMLVALRTLRIVRVFKLVRHSQRLRKLSAAIGRSLRDLGFILFLYVVMVIIFASIIYYAEKMSGDVNTQLKNIPEAMWYTVVTTTTLG